MEIGKAPSLDVLLANAPPFLPISLMVPPSRRRYSLPSSGSQGAHYPKGSSPRVIGSSRLFILTHSIW